MSTLERKYQKLMSVYPSDYLEHRQEEMLTTLLTSARDGQRTPSIKQSLDLVSSGLRIRAASCGHSSRADARTWAGLIASCALAAVTAMMLALHLTGSWTDELPPLFVPMWVGAGLLSVAFFLGRVEWSGRWLFVAFPAIGVILGPSQALAQRTLMVAITLFSVIICLHPRRTTPTHRVIAAVVAVAAGLLGAVSVWHSVGQLPVSSRQRQAFLIRETIGIPSSLIWLIVPVLVALVIILWRWPATAITAGLVAIPIALAGSVLSDQRDFSAWRAHALGTAAAVSVVALAACLLGTVRTLRRPDDSGKQLELSASGDS